jgi:hypothetical protein
LVLKDGSRPVIEGVILGFALAAGARVGMQPWFTEPVTAIDPVALVSALVPAGPLPPHSPAICPHGAPLASIPTSHSGISDPGQSSYHSPG